MKRTFIYLILDVVLLLTLMALPAIAPMAPGCKDQRPWLESRLARAIAHAEGYDASWTIPARQHNPGAFLWAHQRGARRGVAGYALFATAEDGWRELGLRVHQRAGMTIRDILRYHNPKHPGYPALVLSGTGLDADMVIADQTACMR